MTTSKPRSPLDRAGIRICALANAQRSMDDPKIQTYWLEDELRDMGRPTAPRDVVAAIRKHFTIGKVQ